MHYAVHYRLLNCNICTDLAKTNGHEFIADYIIQYVINDNSSGSDFLVCVHSCAVPCQGVAGRGQVASGVLGQGCLLWPAPRHHWAPVVLFLALSGLHNKTSVIRFVCSDSQYDPTAVFEDQPYGRACIRSADICLREGATNSLLKSL